ncbi:hypothetical protein [Brucella pituitosa]|uniref:phage adaptor protein n=1 Tax=Brucella pituitosa TaxID=571256 RepID=UPI0009A21B85|nr:hypothetical protein [Brucella pituitosa]
MAITVQTGGPNNTIPSLLDPADRTFYDMLTVISDEIDDTTGEYLNQIQTCIFKAIRVCEREPYYFNETRDTTFQTVAGQEWYDSRDNPNIASLVRIVAAYSEDGDAQRRVLTRVSPDELETLSYGTAAKGQPNSFTYFGQRIRLYPIPGEQEYTIRLQLGPYRLGPVQSADDSNVWFTEAFDMVKARAKFELYRNYLQDEQLAVAALDDYREQDGLLKAETSRRNGSGRIKATAF